MARSPRVLVVAAPSSLHEAIERGVGYVMGRSIPVIVSAAHYDDELDGRVYDNVIRCDNPESPEARLAMILRIADVLPECVSATMIGDLDPMIAISLAQRCEELGVSLVSC